MNEDPDLDEEPDKPAEEVLENIDQDGQGGGVDIEINGGPNVRFTYLNHACHC